tara:strand:- start:390 stop:629 length:240 start_codon:yes stop_codon:yes gene_type:complete
MKFFFILGFLIANLVAHAQETELAEEELSPPSESQDVDDEEAQLEDNGENITPDSNSGARFIPTEQISQDLGVSFPVDI